MARFNSTVNQGRNTGESVTACCSKRVKADFDIQRNLYTRKLMGNKSLLVKRRQTEGFEGSWWIIPHLLHAFGTHAINTVLSLQRRLTKSHR